MVIDVSENNGRIDWAKVKAAGVTHAIIRCGYGKDIKKQDDKQYINNMDGALANGIKVGVYFYSYASNISAAWQEAAHAIRLIDPYKTKLSLPVFYDLEENDYKSAAKENARAFITELNKAGYNVGIYSSSSWFKNILNGVDCYARWVAQWGTNDGKKHTKPSNADVWQYTSVGTVNGISGRVDMNEIINTNMKPLIDGSNNNDDGKGGDTVTIELPVIKLGDKGEAVKTVQRLLNALGFRDQNGAMLKVDGDAGKRTIYAATNFQRANGMTGDGIVGVKTWNALLM